MIRGQIAADYVTGSDPEKINTMQGDPKEPVLAGLSGGRAAEAGDVQQMHFPMRIRKTAAHAA